MQPDAELCTVAAQRLNLCAGHRVGDRQLDSDGRHVVVLGGDGEVGPANLPPSQAQAVEGLRAGDLVHQVQVDIENVGFTLGPVDDVCVPHLLGKGRAHDLLLLALLRRKCGRLAIDLRMLVPARSLR